MLFNDHFTSLNHGFFDAVFLFLSSANLVLKANFFSLLSFARATWFSVERLPLRAYF